MVRFFLSLALLLPFLSNAQINFKPYQSFNYSTNQKVTCSGDVNNDGLDDMVLGAGSGSYNQYKVTVLLQGSFNSPAFYFYTNGNTEITSLTIADVNNDQLKDVIIGYKDSIGILFQNNSGTLNPLVSYYSGTTVDGLKTGDLNNDGLKDIVVSHWNEQFIKVFYQSASGFTTTTYPAVQGGYNKIEVADINGDLKDDVIFVPGQLVGAIYIYTQNTAGSLNNFVAYLPPGYPSYNLEGIAIGDLNNDGLNDLVGTRGGNMPYAKIAIWLQNPTTHTLQAPVEKNAYEIPDAIQIADLDCDGKNEIVVIHGVYGAATVYTQNSMGQYNSYTKFSIPTGTYSKPHGASIGDFNNDGRKDVAIAAGSVVLWNNSLPLNATADSTIQNDTVRTITYQQTTFYRNHSFIRDSTYRATTDSLRILNRSIRDSIHLDTTIIRNGTICSGNFSDTIHNQHIIYKYTYPRDTTLIVRYNTTVRYDTVRTFLDEQYYHIMHLSLIDDSLYTVHITDSFKVTVDYYNDTIYADSTIIRTRFLSSGAVSDTMYGSNIIYNYTIDADTVFVSTHRDTSLKNTGINNLNQSANVHVYPNPVTDILRIEVPQYANTPLQFRLYNNLGKLVKQEEHFSGTTFNINMEQLPPGAYFLKVSANNLAEMIPVIKK